MTAALFLAVLGFSFATGLYAWPPIMPGLVFILFWIVNVKVMPDEERRALASIPGLHAGKFIGRGLWVAAAWALGWAVRVYGPGAV